MKEKKDGRLARKKRLWTLLGWVLFCLLMIVFAVFWMKRPTESLKEFKEPKLTIVHVDDEPFMRMKLAENERYRPISIMAGTNVRVECEVVSQEDKRRFSTMAFGQHILSEDCQVDIDVPLEIGLHETLVIEFFDGDVTSPTDTIEVPLVTVAGGEQVIFHGLEEESGRPIRGVSVPHKVRVYGRAIADLNPEDNPVALFFVADSFGNHPLLQILPLEEGETQVTPNIGRVVRYRSYGKELEGYAIWSDTPLMVGDEGGSRQVWDLYIGIFRTADVPKVLKQTLSVSIPDPKTLVLASLIPNIEPVRRMTIGGNMLSQPLHVVRNIKPTSVHSMGGGPGFSFLVESARNSSFSSEGF